MGTAQQLLIYGAAASGVTWNPADVMSGGTNATFLSNGNLTINGPPSGGFGGARATVSHSATGKYYYEVLATTVTINNRPKVGVANASWDFNSNVAGAWYIQSSPDFAAGAGGSVETFVTYASGDVYLVAVDFAAGKIWWGKNGTWILSGNPATGANPSFTGLTGTLFPAISVSAAAPSTARFAATDFAFAAPSGFSPW